MRVAETHKEMISPAKCGASSVAVENQAIPQITRNFQHITDKAQIEEFAMVW